MKKKLHKIIAFTLAFVVTCCSLGLNFPTSAGATSTETESKNSIGNEFYMDFTDISGEELDKYFTAGKMSTSGSTINVKPSELFTSDNNPDGNTSSACQNNYLKTKTHKTGLSVLTLKDTTAVNFKVSLEMLMTYTVVGMFFGTDSTPADDIKIDTNNIDPSFGSFETSGYGHIHQLDQDGKLFVQGIDASTSKWVDTERTAELQQRAQWYRTKDTTALPNYDSTVNNTNLHTLNIEVINGTVKVWWTGFEKYAWTSQMLENYKGGSISIYMNGCQQGGLKSFSYDNFDGNYQKFYKDFTKVDASELDGYFTAGRITSNGNTVGVKPSELFTSDVNPDGNTSYLYQNNYLKAKTQGGGFSVLTLKDTTATNFKISMEVLMANYYYGVLFGTDATPTDNLTTSGNATDIDSIAANFETTGYGHVHQLGQNGTIFVQGIDANTSKWVDTERTAELQQRTQWYRTKDTAALPNYDGTVNNTNLHILNIEVINGAVKVWWTGFEQYAWTSQMLENYEGGSISIYMNGCRDGGLKSLSFENYGGYSKSFSKNSLSDLDADFATSIVSAKTNGTATSGTAETYWKKESNSLRPITAGDTQVTLLSLKDKQYKNFRATIDILGTDIGENSYGLIFGQDAQTTVTTMYDHGTGEHGAVRVAFRSNYGAIAGLGVRYATAKSVGTGTVKLHGGDAWWARNNNYDSNTALEGFNTSVNVKHVMNIEVIDGILKMWWSETPDKVWQVEVNEYYRGGYVSLWGMGNRNGGIQRFSIMELPENDYTFAVTDPTDLDDAFTATVFDNANTTVETKKVSESWMVTNKTNETTGEYADGIGYKNNALKPFKNKGESQTYLLSLKEELANNFAMDYTYVTGYTDVGLYLSDNLETEPVGSPSVDSVKISISQPGDGSTYLRIYGAIDIESATTVDNTIAMNNNGASVNVPLNGMAYEAGIAKNNRETIHVQVQERKLTAWVEGYETAKVTVNLNADFNANKLSFFSNGNNQGGFVSMNIDMLPDDATFTSNINFDIQPIGEYTKVTVSTDLDHSSIIGTLNFDNTRYEYFGAALNQNQIIANQGDYITVGEGTLELNIRVNPQNEVLNLYFKNLDTSMNYESILANGINGYVANQNEVNVVTTRELDQDYTEDYVLNAKDIVRAKVENSTTVEDVRKVLVGANAETVSPLLGKTALYLGDSIAYGSNDTLRLSWAGRIAQKGMTYDKVAVSGWSVTNTETSGRGQIVTQLDNATKDSYDFVILEGGVNDVLMMQNGNDTITWGEVQADSTSYDTSTIAGAIEDLIVQTQEEFPDAIVGYVINNYFGASEENMPQYIATVKAACDKHGVPYVDLNADDRTGEDVFYRNCEFYDDGWLHPNAAGYDIIAPVIAEWMEGLMLGAASN